MLRSGKKWFEKCPVGSTNPISLQPGMFLQENTGADRNIAVC